MALIIIIIFICTCSADSFIMPIILGCVIHFIGGITLGTNKMIFR